MKIKSKIHSLQKEIISLRRDFHQYPELGWKEFRTSEKIVNYLKGIDVEIERIAYPGVVAILRGKKPGATLLMRSDMDALPIQEENDIPYKSLHPGLMHACGHDGHMAILLVVAKILSEYKDAINGNIKFVFQPDEESAEGAKKMIEEGILENPKVNASIGLHLWSHLQTGFIGLKTGAIMASLSTFKVKIIGRGGHTGYPEAAIDPIIAAANIIQQVQTIQTREMSRLNPLIIMFGKVSGGTANNIIPDTVEMEGTLRFLNQGGERETINPNKRFIELIHSIAKCHRVKVEIQVKEKNKMVINEPDMVQIIRSSAKHVLGKNNIIDFSCTASEDFSEFSHCVPSVFYFLGCTPLGQKNYVSHHNCFFDIDENALALGVEIQVRSALEYFNHSHFIENN